MNRLLFLVAVLIFLTLPVRAQEVPPPSVVGLTPSAADVILHQQFDKAKGVGMSVAIVRDGKIVLAKGYGKASLSDNKPVTTETRFEIGSVTKQFTSACILLLAEEGKLSVTDKVAMYYPDLTRAGDITLLDLMNHVSGYPDFFPLDFVDRRMTKSIAPDQLLKVYAGGKLDFEPGTRFSYSNTGYILLGRIVEKVSGQPLGKYLQARVFGPLGMTHTNYEPQRTGSDDAQGYSRFMRSEPEPSASIGRGWIGGAGAIRSTPTDLAKWNLALIDGKVLKPESYRLMTMPRRLANGAVSGYGCGLSLGTRNGVMVLEHGGGTSGFLTNNVAIPATRSAFIVCINSDSWNESLSGAQIVAALLPAPLSAPKPKETAETPAPAQSVVPTIGGATAEDAARTFFVALQKGDLKGVALGEEFEYYLKKKGLATVAARLKVLGSLTKVEVSPPQERGGMAVCYVTLTVGTQTLGGAMYRSPDGKLQQLLLE